MPGSALPDRHCPPSGRLAVFLLAVFFLQPASAQAAVLGTTTFDNKSPYSAFTVKSWTNGNLVSFKPSFRRMTISWEAAGKKLGLEAKLKGLSITRIYENLKGKRMYRGAPSGSGFSLQTAEQEELFRVGKDISSVTITESKGKKRQYVIRSEERDLSALYEGEKLLGGVVYKPDVQVASLRDATGRELYFMYTDRPTDTLAMLLLPKDISMEHKYVMMAELLVRER